MAMDGEGWGGMGRDEGGIKGYEGVLGGIS